MRSTQYLKIALAVGIIVVVLLLVQSFGFETVFVFAVIIAIPIVVFVVLLRWQNIALRSPVALQMFIGFAVMLPFLYGFKPFGISFPYNVMIIIGAEIVVNRLIDRFSGSPTAYQIYIKHPIYEL